MSRRKFDWYVVGKENENGKYAFVFGLDKGDNIVDFLVHNPNLKTMVYCSTKGEAIVNRDIMNDEFWVNDEIDMEMAKCHGYSRRNFDDDSKAKVKAMMESEA